jgi:hypothetical protein
LDIGIRGFAPGFPEPLEGFCDGPSAEPFASLGLLGALDDEASRVFFTIEVIYPRVLMPDDDVLASGGGVADFPTDEV